LLIDVKGLPVVRLPDLMIHDPELVGCSCVLGAEVLAKAPDELQQTP